MVLDRPLAAVTAQEARALHHRMCAGKTRFGPEGARHSAERPRAEGIEVSAYRCCWCAAWHTGHTPCMDTIELLARLLRFGVEDGAL